MRVERIQHAMCGWVLGLRRQLGRFRCGSIFQRPSSKKDSLPMRKKRIHYVCKYSSKRRDQLLLWSGASKRRAECDALGVEHQASEPTLTASVWRRRDMPSALESTCLGILYFDTRKHPSPARSDCCCCSLRVRTHGEARAECASLGPSPSQLTVVWRRRDAPRSHFARCHYPTHRSFCCLFEWINILNLETMPFFDLNF